MGRKARTIDQDFIIANCIPEPMSGCWLWTGPTHKDCTAVGQRAHINVMVDGVCRQKLASRIAYELFRGPIPEKLCVCHACDNGMCVNPDHLFVGTHQDNVTDMVKKNRHAKGSKQGSSKLNEDQVRQIREMVERGEKQRDVARHFGISQGNVAFVAQRISWRWLE